MVQEKKKRRRVYLGQTSQPRILITMLALLGFVAVILMVFVYIDVNMRLTERYPGFSSIQPVILTVLVIVNLVAAVFCVILMLIFSHRIAGPIYNLGRVLRGISQGDLSNEIRFRKRDFLQEIANDGNQALEYLRQEIGDMQKTSEELVSRLEGAQGTGNNPGLQEDALQEARDLRDRLGKFRIVNEQ